MHEMGILYPPISMVPGRQTKTCASRAKLIMHHTNVTQSDWKSSCSAFGSLSALVTSILLLGAASSATAQSDNFDSGTLSSAWTVYQGVPQRYTFPPVGTGKGLRIQTSPVPAFSLPAVAGIAQSNVYDDFYVALDLANWVVEDQAMVLFARFAPGGNLGLDGGQGMILNYDAA